MKVKFGVFPECLYFKYLFFQRFHGVLFWSALKVKYIFILRVKLAKGLIIKINLILLIDRRTSAVYLRSGIFFLVRLIYNLAFRAIGYLQTFYRLFTFDKRTLAQFNKQTNKQKTSGQTNK